MRVIQMVIVLNKRNLGLPFRYLINSDLVLRKIKVFMTLQCEPGTISKLASPMAFVSPEEHHYRCLQPNFQAHLLPLKSDLKSLFWVV